MWMMYDCQAFELAKRAQIEIEDQIKVAYNDHTEADELADQTIEEVSNDKHVVGFHMWCWPGYSLLIYRYECQVE